MKYIIQLLGVSPFQETPFANDQFGGSIFRHTFVSIGRKVQMKPDVGEEPDSHAGVGKSEFAEIMEAICGYRSKLNPKIKCLVLRVAKISGLAVVNFWECCYVDI